MKVVNEKGKLFGLINVVDLLVIVFVIAVIAGVVWKVGFNKVADAFASDMEIKFTVKVEQVDKEIYDKIVETLPAPIMNQGSYVDSEVVSAEFLEYIDVGEDEYGNKTYYADETMCNVLFTATCMVPKNSVNLPVGSQEVRLGKAFILKTRNFELTGTIMSLDIPE